MIRQLFPFIAAGVILLRVCAVSIFLRVMNRG